MPPLKDISRKAVITISLLTWFVPSLFLLIQLAKNGTSGLQQMLILPNMYGLTLTMWLGALLQHNHALFWIVAVIISLGLPTLLVALMFRFSRRRSMVLSVGLIVSCLLTAAAHCLLRA